MFSIIDWKLGLGAILIFWIFLNFGRSLPLLKMIPRHIKPLSIVVPLLWWEIGAISFQRWQLAFTPYGFLILILWGIALALYQGFWEQRYTVKRFIKIWWRVIEFATTMTLIIFIIMSWGH
ncbi:DUF3397 domain-containing protein [Weissella coleopterorum]|uniref:DUF3397 domain-containing protein n=1 Tax=Weissella coleopterorum TaxID=2714949 RepID=A0A6G8B0Y3_9LACO|nr:DUF3397 family protein [Weissella coleopterorum]QIL50968.1 DUF3397 domain-containing protein [Weissella coleopterorum]